ncbi:MAG: DUF5696 domain-containing protein [Bacillota bacterium]|jgi:hypothetical protein|nr:DUF5696 domain-containing protein [Bacillota bacterium]
MIMKKITALIITAALLMSCSAAFADAGSDQADKSALQSMKMVAENDYLALYINEETTEAAVKDKKTGQVWYTNPPDRADDPIAAAINKDKLASQISLSYFTPTSQQKLMNNYTDCIRYEQFEITPIDNGVRIVYRIGREEKIYILPQIISKERMEEMILKNLDAKTGKQLVSRYRLISLEKAKTEKQRQDMLKDFPTAENGDLYVLGDNIRDFMKESLQEIVISSGYTLEDMNEDHEANNVPVAEENKERFIIPLEYTLEEDNLVVRVPTDEIEYNADSYPIYTMSLLEFFGAAGTDESGYILVPDGSGSLIYLNNKKFNTQAYAIDVYGYDESIPIPERTSTIEQAYLPVYGMKRGDNAFFAIIESGDALSRVWADISGRLNSYNTVYSSFILVQNDVLDIGDFSGNNTIMVYQPRVFKGDIKVRYKFLKGEDANYAGMAAYYRSYLEKLGMTREKPRENIPFFLEVIGAIDKVKPILGIPVKTVEPLTTYEQAMEIIDELNDAGISEIVLKYTGWANGGIDHTIPKSLKLMRKLGGSKGFKKLQSFLDGKGIEYFPELGFILNYRDKLLDSFIPLLHASRYITKEVASVFRFNLATNMPYRAMGTFYVISPTRIPSIVDGMIKSLKKLSVPGISLRDAAMKVNSDFKESKLVDRQQARVIVEDQIKKIRDSGLSIMAKGGNAYALPYTDYILNIPEDSNQFFLTDESIPFFQMVVRGYITYAGTPINMASDYRKAFLKSIETGSGIYFSFIYEENSLVKQTYFDHYYSNEYRLWMDEARRFYHRANEALADVQGQTIKDHEKIAEGVYKTTFEKGKEIIVNYTSKPVEVNGAKVEPLDFKVVKEGQ